MRPLQNPNQVLIQTLQPGTDEQDAALKAPPCVQDQHAPGTPAKGGAT
jgi:hypothetical protein